ncbi:hypothetical protein HDU96_011075 [Phlyctochytrium bullatum]|nr:hypothetical protein HDU96_011075 [Phlyctochytrium bullatum]
MHQFTEKTDIYSYGVVCTELSTWKGPFGASYPIEEMVFHHVENRHALPKLIHPSDVSKEFQSICSDCLHLASEKRPSFAEIVKRLGDVFLLVSKNWRELEVKSKKPGRVANKTEVNDWVHSENQATGEGTSIEDTTYEVTPTFVMKALTQLNASRSFRPEVRSTPIPVTRAPSDDASSEKEPRPHELVRWAAPSGAEKLHEFNPLLLQCRNAAEHDNLGYTALHVAAEAGWTAGVKVMLTTGWASAVLNSVTSEGATAMHLAARKGFVDVVRELVEAGADLAITDRRGQTSRDVASESGFEKMVKFFDMDIEATDG